jgi:hypothetical protein
LIGDLLVIVDAWAIAPVRHALFLSSFNQQSTIANQQRIKDH